MHKKNKPNIYHFLWESMFIFESITGCSVVVFLSGSESVQGFLPLYNICIAVGDPVIREEGWDPINRFNPARLFVPVPSEDLDF